MKIKSIRIQNFRSFSDATIQLNDYSCFVGPNGCGKSSVLAALNVFFSEKTMSTTDTVKLIDEDFHCKRTAAPIRITVTFHDLSAAAAAELADYVRLDELIVTAEAVYAEDARVAPVRHYGQRLGMEQFRPFFDADKAGAKVADLREIYAELQRQLPDLAAATTKPNMTAAIHAYEAAHPDQCVLIPSTDEFYGINGTGKLAPFIQWIYVPAVKDAGEEGLQNRNTALDKLLKRAVENVSDLDDELKALKTQTEQNYQEVLDRHNASLEAVSTSLQRRLGAWGQPSQRLNVSWQYDPAKSVTVQTPAAGIKTGDDHFIGDLARMGHGIQRSYLLALLQELAASDQPDAPTLLLGCEEPELYQHPPQARHLAEVFDDLAQGNNQILVTTHSPLFVSGDGFENVRLVRRNGNPAETSVRALAFDNLCTRVRTATGEDLMRRTEGFVAKLHQALQPGLAEMFFCGLPILVEGLEDVSYITTHLHLTGRWSDFRRLGCHLIPVHRKDNLIQPLAIARELDLPLFVIFDSDGDNTRPDQRPRHERDNTALLHLLDDDTPPFPVYNVFGPNFVVWTTNISDCVRADFEDADYDRVTEAARQYYAMEGGLNKNDLFIAEWLTNAHAADLHSPTLDHLCDAILTYAQTEA